MFCDRRAGEFRNSYGPVNRDSIAITDSTRDSTITDSTEKLVKMHGFATVAITCNHQAKAPTLTKADSIDVRRCSSKRLQTAGRIVYCAGRMSYISLFYDGHLALIKYTISHCVEEHREPLQPRNGKDRLSYSSNELEGDPIVSAKDQRGIALSDVESFE